MKLLILILSFCLTLEYYHQLSQYKSISFYGSDNFYLNLDGFKSGDKIYIELSFDTYWYTSSFSFYYKQSNYLSDSEFTSGSFTLMRSNVNSESGYYETKYYTITLSGNYKYLLFKFSGGSNVYYTVKHSKTSATWIIFTVIGVLVMIIAIVVIIQWCRRRMREKEAAEALVPSPQPQPQIALQPQPQPPQPYYSIL